MAPGGGGAGTDSSRRRALLERTDAQATLTSALRGAAAGAGSAVFLVGSAGIGKTSVLDWASAAARRRGFRVASAVGSPMETGLPFGLLGQPIVALGGSAVEDEAELARLGGGPARFYRTLRWLGAVAAETPLLIVLDDLHWADADSLELLGFLGRRLAGTRILVVGTLRPEPDRASALAHELVGSGHARLLPLEPLSRAASEDLAARIVGRPLDEPESDRLWRACAGTPLLLELAGRALRTGAPLPLRLGMEQSLAFLLERFAGLGEDVYRYVQAASIFGVRFRPAFASALAGLGEEEGMAAHVRLVRARLLDDLGGGSASFVHPLFAQALLEAQPHAVRERQHARAFRLLVDAGVPDAVAAEHAAAAHLVGDALSVDVIARAGRFAFAQGALAAAARHLGSAVELAADNAPDGLLLDYAFALIARARIDEGTAICERLLDSELEPAMRVRVLRLLARTAAIVGRPADAERLYAEAVEAAAKVDRSTEAATLADAALTCMVASPVPWVVDMTARARDRLPPHAPEHRLLELVAAYGHLMAGDAAAQRRFVGAAAGWSERAALVDPSWAWTLAVHVLNAYKTVEDFAAATELFEREFERAIEDGAPILMNALAIAYADAIHRLGRPEEALALVDRAAVLSEWPMAPWTDLARAVLLRELGRDDEALLHVEALRSFRDGMPPQYFAAASLWLDLLDARQLLALGDAARASETMLHAAEVARLTGWQEPCIVPWASVALDAHVAAGDPDRVRVLLDGLEAVAAPLSCRWPKAVAALGRARLAAMEGRPEQADAGFESALRAFAELPLPLARAEALITHGRHLRHCGRPRAARTPLAEALALAEQCRSVRLVRLAREELAACGGRRRRPAQDGFELTPQQARVARLAADGLSNAAIAAALYLSPKTVDHHLQHVYAKLGLHSRRDLIRRASELAAPEPLDA